MRNVVCWVIVAITPVLAAGSGIFVYRRGGAYGEKFFDHEPHTQRITDPITGALKVIAFDRNRNGRMDSWTYYGDDGRMIRTEADDDEDGLIDHWFEYDAAENVVRMGLSTRGDGVVDAWWYEGPEGGNHWIDYYDRQTNQVARTELYNREGLVRVAYPAQASR
jgi:hypothetical protein